MELSPGTLVGTYEIFQRLGAGGMGEVYYARDIRLGRYVALKLLLPDLTGDEARLRRFEQEARATSALNHPNILTIFEIGQHDGLHYMVTEFIEGVTLRQHCAGKELQLGEILEIAIQVAAALSAAHESGIVHRDVKPENIMLRPDGYLKVLDFGLAKLVPSQSRRLVDKSALTALNVNTEPGAVVGTVNYMSPEQVRGMKLDGRADIWSLGVLIYEMVAGRTPFAGSTKSDVIAAILREDPPPLLRYSANVPAELQRIVSLALKKDEEERCQLVKDMLIDLRALKQEVDLGVSLGRRETAPESRGATAGSADGRSATAEDPRAVRETNDIAPARATSGVVALVGEIKRHRFAAGALLTVLAIMVTVSGIWLGVRRWRKIQGQTQGTAQVTEIVTTSNAREAVVSPDGKYVATIVEEGGKQSVRIQQPGKASESSIVATGDEHLRGLKFSRDGYSVYYLAKEDRGSALYQAAVLGSGVPRKIAGGLLTPISLSPDGAQITFVRRKENGTVLIIAQADDSAERELAFLAGASEFATFVEGNNGPAWSPDGRLIAIPTLLTGDLSQMDVVTVRTDDGSMTPLGLHWYFIGQVEWLADGSGLIMTALEKPMSMSTTQLWFVPAAGGDSRRLTNDTGAYSGISLTADARTLVTTRATQNSRVWIVPGADVAQAIDLPASKNKGLGGMTWTADDNIIYSSAESGAVEVWSMSSNGANAKQLTFDRRTNFEPAVARGDSPYLVFASYGTGQNHIWRMGRDGSDLKQLTSGTYEDWPDVSPDGLSVVYHAYESSHDRIWKTTTDGGPPTLLLDRLATHPAISPDGTLIACFLGDAEGSFQLAVIPFAGGAPVQTFAIPASVAGGWHGARWTADGQGITYIVTQGGVSNIWLQPLTGEPPRQLTNFLQDQIFAFAWSLDGRKLACVRGAGTTSVVLMKEFLSPASP